MTFVITHWPPVSRECWSTHAGITLCESPSHLSFLLPSLGLLSSPPHPGTYKSFCSCLFWIVTPALLHQGKIPNLISHGIPFAEADLSPEKSHFPGVITITPRASNFSQSQWIQGEQEDKDSDFANLYPPLSPSNCYLLPLLNFHSLDFITQGTRIQQPALALTDLVDLQGICGQGTAPVFLKAGPWDWQYQNHLGICWRCVFSGPTPDLLKLWGWGILWVRKAPQVILMLIQVWQTLA